MTLFRRLPWVLALLTASPTTRAFGADASWHVVRADVRVVCPMTVGGSFEARSGAMRGTVTTGGPGAALEDELSVDLQTLDTGIGLRSEHLRNKNLEVGRDPGFDRAVQSAIGLGDAEPESLEGRTPFTGLLHGTARAIAGQATWPSSTCGSLGRATPKDSRSSARSGGEVKTRA